MDGDDSQPKAAYSSKSRARMLQERREAAKKKNAITLGASGGGSPARGGAFLPPHCIGLIPTIT
jgi:hypothetical protein